MQADVVYVNDEIVILNKPAGIPSHPLALDENPITALSLVAARFPEVLTASSNSLEGGLIHRLDNDTSGLLVFARHQLALRKWRNLFKNSEVKKSYVAIVNGMLKEKITLNRPIAHHPKSKQKMMVIGDGRRYFRGKPQEALTGVVPIASNAEVTLVQVEIRGGRRHQIRVHLARAGFPLIGDVLYGGKPAKYLSGHALHADALLLPNGQLVLAPLPQEFQQEANGLANKYLPQAPGTLIGFH